MKRFFDKIKKIWNKSIKQNAMQIRNDYILWELRWRQSLRMALAKMLFGPEKITPKEHKLLCTNSFQASLIALEDNTTFIEIEE